MLNAIDYGSIVWDRNTGFIIGVYRLTDTVPSDVTWLDGKGCEAYPAGIDLHVHSRPGQPTKEDPEHLTRACITGGVGTIFTMPNGDPHFTRISQLELFTKPWENSPLTAIHHFGATKDNLEEIVGLGSSKHKCLGGVKVFYASSTGNLLVPDYPTQLKVAQAAGLAGMIQLIHAEDEDLIKGKRQEIERSHPLLIEDHWRVRPSEVEVRSIERAIRICRDVRVRTHICHVSTPKGLEKIADAKAAGLPITCETAPHYWRLHAGYLSTMGGRAKMNPALRPEAEMLRIRDLLCQGLVDVVASDHAPHEPGKKALTEYDKCPSGVPGVQTLGLMVYDLKASGSITAQRFVDLTSGNAARMFGLNKGELAAGKDADIVLINPNKATVFTDAGMQSQCGWTPFHGQSVQGSIETVVLRGRVVMECPVR